jgi:hypothetical protein
MLMAARRIKVLTDEMAFAAIRLMLGRLAR